MDVIKKQTRLFSADVGERVEDNQQWSVPPHRWLDIGDDYVFICRSVDREERWFRLRQDYAGVILDVACQALLPPWDGLLAAYQSGLGPWGDEPWIATDFNKVVRQLGSVSEAALPTPDVREAWKALQQLLRVRCLAGDVLVVDDGSGKTGRFPQADPGWTETGRPLEDSILVRYRHCSGGNFELDDLDIPQDILAFLAVEIRPIESFRSDPRRPYLALTNLRGVLQRIRHLEPLPYSLYSFVNEAEQHSWPVALQSAGRFPLGVPPD